MRNIATVLRRIVTAVKKSCGTIPKGFDCELYLKLNPDLKNAGVDPTEHYLLFGRKEGRIFSVPKMDIRGDNDFKADQDTILLVSHEASRSGAPILSLNIVQHLAGRYNIVVLILEDIGPLFDSFLSAGAAVAKFFNLKENPVQTSIAIRRLSECFDFKFAIVNSLESRLVLRPLAEHFIPTISLIHEFASCYTRPREVFSVPFIWSSELVFSANVVLENALAEFPDLSNRTTHILPQGKCHVPLEEGREESLCVEREHIRSLIRPKDLPEDSLVVLGAGYVNIRKGVDLFLQCAARVIRAKDGRNYRFVWVGQGYDPYNDHGYSVYLADQIRRAGLEEHVYFTNETPFIETVYEETDLLLLSSRLDPLPNVAIDALAHGLPVLCFNKTTGIADFLIESGLGGHCVAEYLDSAELSEKILALAASKILREHVGNRCREASLAYFNMKEYVTCLEKLAQGARVHTQQELELMKLQDANLSLLNNEQHRQQNVLPLLVEGLSAINQTKIGRAIFTNTYLRRLLDYCRSLLKRSA